MALKSTTAELEEQDADGEMILDQDAIVSELMENDPGSVLSCGKIATCTQDAKVQKTDGNTMSASFVIVTRMKTPNRNGNINQIAPSDKGQGLLIENYQRNPIVLLDHGNCQGIPYLGKSQDPDGNFTLKLAKQKATATVYFSQTLAFAAEIFGLVDEGILRMASIAFNPLKAQRINYKAPDLAEGVIDTAPGGPNGWGGFDFTESDLCEWSIVGVGADPGALRQCLSRQMVGQEKLRTQSVRHWIEQRAEAKPAIGIGFDSSIIKPVSQSATIVDAQGIELVTVELNGMKISGTSETVATTIQKLQSPGVVAQSSLEIATEPVDRNANLVANTPQVAVQSTDLSKVLLAEIASGLAQEIEKAFAPCLQASQQTLKQLQLLTGASQSS